MKNFQYNVKSPLDPCISIGTTAYGVLVNAMPSPWLNQADSKSVIDLCIEGVTNSPGIGHFTDHTNSTTYTLTAEEYTEKGRPNDRPL